MRKKSKNSQPVIDAHDHHALVRQMLAILPWFRSRSRLKTPAINPHHHRPLRLCRNPRGPHVQIQAILARPNIAKLHVLINSRLHAPRAKFSSLPQALPRSYRLRRFPPQFPDGWRRKRYTLKNHYFSIRAVGARHQARLRAHLHLRAKGANPKQHHRHRCDHSYRQHIHHCFSPSAPSVGSVHRRPRAINLPSSNALIKSKLRREPYNIVGRLTRRIYIYGLDGLVGIPQNFQVCRSQYARNKAIARSIQEIATPQHPAFPPSPIPGPQFSLAVAWPAAKSLGTISLCIQESNLPHQIFSGIVAFIGVTYPTVWIAHWRLPSCAPQSSPQKFQPKSEVCSHSATDLHGSLVLPEGCS